MVSEIAYVALGSNVWDRDGHLSRARRRIAALPRTRIVAESAIEETEPLGPPGQGNYLNQMVAVETDLPPLDLLSELQKIENAAGRSRGQRWGPRTLDLDIVRYGDTQMSTPALTLPHPQLSNRDFWQRELAQVHVQ